MNGLVDILFLELDGFGSSRVTTVSCKRVVLDCIALGQKRMIWNGLIPAPQAGAGGQERLGVLLGAGEHNARSFASRCVGMADVASTDARCWVIVRGHAKARLFCNNRDQGTNPTRFS